SFVRSSFNNDATTDERTTTQRRNEEGVKEGQGVVAGRPLSFLRRHYFWSLLINGLGATATGVTLLVVLVAKFTEGAWIMLVLIPSLLVLFLAVRRHYQYVARELASKDPLPLGNLKPPLVLVLIRGWTTVTRKALRFAMKISPDVHALHVAADEMKAVDVRE